MYVSSPSPFAPTLSTAAFQVNFPTSEFTSLLMAPSAMPGTPSSLATLSTPAVPWALAWVELRVVVVVGGWGGGEVGWDGMGEMG